jgi:SNF2 family DNA or RNA helicase
MQMLMTQLRKVCNHPQLMLGGGIDHMRLNDLVDQSGKLQVRQEAGFFF